MFSELLKKLNETSKKHAEAKAKFVAKDYNRLIVKHSLREGFRTRAAAAGEKVTEARLEDLSVSSEEYKEACQAAVDACAEMELSGAEARVAFYEYEAAMALYKAEHSL